METLGTATDEHDLLALEGFNTTAEFRMFHETAVANFFELATHRDRIEIIHFFEPLLNKIVPAENVVKNAAAKSPDLTENVSKNAPKTSFWSRRR